MTASRTVALPSGETVPALGQGTWGMGDRRERRTAEIAALRLGIEFGHDAHRYGGNVRRRGGGRDCRRSGRRTARKGLRGQQGVSAQCEPKRRRRGVRASLRRLNLDHLDLYLLHWRGSIPLGQTVEGFESLRAAGKIRAWGVSNFDVADMGELARVAKGSDCATNQVLYNIARRGPEYRSLAMDGGSRGAGHGLQPSRAGAGCRAAQRCPPMARKHGASAIPGRARLCDAIGQRSWQFRRRRKPAHMKENHGSLGLSLDEEDLRAMDAGFPPPSPQSRRSR